MWCTQIVVEYCVKSFWCHEIDLNPVFFIQKLNPINYKRSTFFPSWQPSVFMKEEGDEFGGQNPEYYNEIQVSVIIIVFIMTRFII